MKAGLACWSSHLDPTAVGRPPLGDVALGALRARTSGQGGRMHRLLAALAVGGLLVLTAPPVAAQTDPRACFAQTNQAAWSALTQGYNYSPAGYGPFGWAPLAQAFDPALAGAP